MTGDVKLWRAGTRRAQEAQRVEGAAVDAGGGEVVVWTAEARTPVVPGRSETY